MPEGDTIYRSARTLKAALAGRIITGFRTVLPHLARVDVDTPLSGRTVDDVVSRGKHILMFFSGDLILRTHMRMHGAWHLYRPGERWKQPGRDMRIVIATDAFEAVAFRVPVAEFRTAATLERDDVIQSLGPDLLDDNAGSGRGGRTPARARRGAARRRVAQPARGGRHRQRLQVRNLFRGARCRPSAP